MHTGGKQRDRMDLGNHASTYSILTHFSSNNLRVSHNHESKGANLEEEDLPNETEVREEAQTRALLAPFLKFLVLLHNPSLLQSLLRSTTCSTRAKRRLSPVITPKFRGWTCETQKARRRQSNTGKQQIIILRLIKSMLNATNGSSITISLSDRFCGCSEMMFLKSFRSSAAIWATGSRPAEKNQDL